MRAGASSQQQSAFNKLKTIGFTKNTKRHRPIHYVYTCFLTSSMIRLHSAQSYIPNSSQFFCIVFSLLYFVSMFPFFLFFFLIFFFFAFKSVGLLLFMPFNHLYFVKFEWGFEHRMCIWFAHKEWKNNERKSRTQNASHRSSGCINATRYVCICLESYSSLGICIPFNLESMVSHAKQTNPFVMGLFATSCCTALSCYFVW